MRVQRSALKNISIKKNAWFSDEDVALQFPDNWIINVFGDQYLPALSDTEINDRLDEPIECLPLSALAEEKKSAIILVDDISRPTPVAKILQNVIERLTRVGFPLMGIKILIANGSHKQPTAEEILSKTGSGIPKGIEIITHDCKNDCVWIEKTSLGTPIYINKHVIEAELKIGIGGIYPHPIAGFSGGNKILALGAAGLDTIRVLHDQRRGDNLRTGEIDHPFRREINEIAKAAGMDFIVNVTINQNRQISGVFAGHPEKAFHQAVDVARKNYSISVDNKADVVIVDMYPFDLDFQFAFDRGLWPFEYSLKNSLKIILADCPKRIGDHELFPVSNPFLIRLKRRIINYKFHDLFHFSDRLHSLNRLIWRRRLNAFIVSQFISDRELRDVIPKGKVIKDWESMLQLLTKKYKGQSNIQLAFYLTAPLMLLSEEEISNE